MNNILPIIKFTVKVELKDENSKMSKSLDLGYECFTFYKPSWRDSLKIAQRLHYIVTDWMNNHIVGPYGSIQKLIDLNKEEFNEK